jgi:hypothetical protein
MKILKQRLKYDIALILGTALTPTILFAEAAPAATSAAVPQGSITTTAPAANTKRAPAPRAPAQGVNRAPMPQQQMAPYGYSNPYGGYPNPYGAPQQQYGYSPYQGMPYQYAPNQYMPQPGFAPPNFGPNQYNAPRMNPSFNPPSMEPPWGNDNNFDMSPMKFWPVPGTGNPWHYKPWEPGAPWGDSGKFSDPPDEAFHEAEDFLSDAPRMPGGWELPNISMPSPFEIGEQVGDQSWLLPENFKMRDKKRPERYKRYINK